VKKMNYPSSRLASRRMPRRIHPLNPSDCHPRTYLSFLSSSSFRRREDGRLDAIAVSSGQSMESDRELKVEETRQEKSSVAPGVRTPGAIYLDVDKRARGLQTLRSMHDVTSVQESWQ
jgi:hypothetical protein